MKILYYECFSGISGDMNLGAMLDLGVSRDFLINELRRLNLEGWRLEISGDHRHGISGTRVKVIVEPDSASDNSSPHHPDHDHDHNEDTDHHHHHDHPHDHGGTQSRSPGRDADISFSPQKP